MSSALQRVFLWACELTQNIVKQETELYDPSAPGSRLGVPAAQLEGVDLTGIEGFHVHNLCECDSYALERTLAAVEKALCQVSAAIEVVKPWWRTLDDTPRLRRRSLNCPDSNACAKPTISKSSSSRALLSLGKPRRWCRK